LGLGLRVTRELVELHGGSIEVGDSDLGGALFRVLFPVEI
jgi:signal transduction histidine kinase